MSCNHLCRFLLSQAAQGRTKIPNLLDHFMIRIVGIFCGLIKNSCAGSAPAMDFSNGAGGGIVEHSFKF
jgi:hypothetical protein